MIRRATVPGRGCLSSCRLHRRSSSLLRARSLNPETPSSTWREPSTSSVSFHNLAKNVLLFCQLNLLPSLPHQLSLTIVLSRHWPCGLPGSCAQARRKAIHYSGVALRSGESPFISILARHSLPPRIRDTSVFCEYFSGGESLQREKLPHHECPRENAQRPGLSSRLVFFFLLSCSLSYTTHVSSFCVIDMWFCFFSVCVRGGDWSALCSHKRFARPFQGKYSTVISHHQDMNK